MKRTIKRNQAKGAFKRKCGIAGVASFVADF